MIGAPNTIALVAATAFVGPAELDADISANTNIDVVAVAKIDTCANIGANADIQAIIVTRTKTDGGPKTKSEAQSEAATALAADARAGKNDRSGVSDAADSALNDTAEGPATAGTVARARSVAPARTPVVNAVFMVL